MYTSVVVNDGCVAQLVEHLTFNQRVSGSNPDALTNKKDFCVAEVFFLYLMSGFEPDGFGQFRLIAVARRCRLLTAISLIASP